jgi:hypothetical protein
VNFGGDGSAVRHLTALSAPLPFFRIASFFGRRETGDDQLRRFVDVIAEQTNRKIGIAFERRLQNLLVDQRTR